MYWIINVVTAPARASRIHHSCINIPSQSIHTAELVWTFITVEKRPTNATSGSHIHQLHLRTHSGEKSNTRIHQSLLSILPVRVVTPPTNDTVQDAMHNERGFSWMRAAPKSGVITDEATCTSGYYAALCTMMLLHYALCTLRLAIHRRLMHDPLSEKIMNHILIQSKTILMRVCPPDHSSLFRDNDNNIH